MRILISLTAVFFLNLGFGQQNLAEKELQLKNRLDELRAAKSDAQMLKINALFTKEMGEFLKSEGAFQFQFTQLKSIADLKSSDQLVRIIHWNLEYKDFSYSYGGFILKWDEDKETSKLFELIDVMDPYTAKPDGVIDSKSWYGALYYAIIPIEFNSEIQYTLLGWDGGTSGSTFKVIDVLSFKGNAAKLGSPLFLQKNKVLKRVVFEFSDKSKMSLRMDEKRNRIVFDHLSPESPVLEGVYQYYMPDFSYDAYVWDESQFVLYEDVIASNDESENKETTIYTMDQKTGKVKKDSYKLKWINPEDPNFKGDIGHVARTPETEINKETDDNTAIEMPKKKWWDRRNPNNLSVTTGKYRKNRRHPPTP